MVHPLNPPNYRLLLQVIEPDLEAARQQIARTFGAEVLAKCVWTKGVNRPAEQNGNTKAARKWTFREAEGWRFYVPIGYRRAT